MRDMAPDNAISGIHWPTAEATSIQNCIFWMSDTPGTQHQGVFIEDGTSSHKSLDISLSFSSIFFANREYAE
jgi:glucan 1,3-beta-glucosidase